MSARTPIGVGQESFREIAEAVPQVRQPNARNTFAEVAKPEYFNLDPELYFDITPEMAAAADPVKLRPDLVDVHRSPKNRLIVGYTPEGGNKTRYVPLFPYEYKLISRTDSPQRYGEVVVANTLAGKKSMLPSVERRNAEAQKHQDDAVEAKWKGLASHLSTHLVPEIGMLDRLIEAAEHPGLQRRREFDTRVAVSTVLEWLLPQVLEVVGRSRDWTDAKHDLAKRSIDYRLFFMRNHNQHLRNWVDMLKLLRDYDQEKANLFADRAGIFGHYLVEHGRPTE